MKHVEIARRFGQQFASRDLAANFSPNDIACAIYSLADALVGYPTSDKAMRKTASKRQELVRAARDSFDQHAVALGGKTFAARYWSK